MQEGHESPEQEAREGSPCISEGEKDRASPVTTGGEENMVTP